MASQSLDLLPGVPLENLHADECRYSLGDPGYEVA